jgi:hypothetical protein
MSQVEKFLQDHKELSSTEQLRLLETIKQQIIQNVMQASSGVRCEKCGFYETKMCQGCGKTDGKVGYVYHQTGHLFCYGCCDTSRTLPKDGVVLFIHETQLNCECENTSNSGLQQESVDDSKNLTPGETGCGITWHKEPTGK